MSLVSGGYRVQISHQIDDPEWDLFLAATPGGCYPQSSLWARTKSVVGFRAIRIIVRQAGEIVGGAQILIHRFPLIGGYGYVAMGPVVRSGHPELAKLLLEELNRVARRQIVHYLVVQPPWGGQAFADQLCDRGFFPTSRTVAPSATLLIDLTDSLDEILAGMKAKTRQKFRRSERSGLVVREGTERDIPVFHRLLVATSKRHNFSPSPEAYYGEVWRSLNPRGFVQLFLAEVESESVTALFVICFGDTMTEWRVGWDGRHGHLHPNEVIRWAAIKWAKCHGYRYYDIGGIHRTVARIMSQGAALPDGMASRNHFKLQFGGKLAVYPEARAYIYNPLLRWLDSAASPKVRQSWPLKMVMDLLH
jgi:lipid II:glycine glycyltransferase (peptidoglycan interpeptide bridge formation enzyme)